ncbi:hypothetical protein SAMN05421579_104104 [Xenorhabdus japonica]|uniref:Uncharacterized protein n=1 Tax=Xenorhabdus japonica TaxID=53341 RepID=A0A1I4Z7B6_9GAMM|nr:hypothetical protein SAMN05421579_104104 [Xenorhabdus japonica]
MMTRLLRKSRDEQVFVTKIKAPRELSGSFLVYFLAAFQLLFN